MTQQTWKRTKGQEFAPLIKLETEGSYIEGYFRGVHDGKTKTGKVFPMISIDAMPNLQNRSMAMAGHLRWLVDQAGLTDGDLIRITFTGWDTTEDGTKVRQYVLEKAETN